MTIKEEIILENYAQTLSTAYIVVAMGELRSKDEDTSELFARLKLIQQFQELFDAEHSKVDSDLELLKRIIFTINPLQNDFRLEGNVTVARTRILPSLFRVADIILEEYLGQYSIALLEARLELLQAALLPHPVYVYPTVQLSVGHTTQNLEVGQVINVPLTISFNANNSGGLTGVTLTRNGAIIANQAPFTDQSLTISTTPEVYRAKALYAEGAVLNNLLGIPDPYGRIEEGSLNSNTISFKGYYRAYFGPISDDIPTESLSLLLVYNQLITGNTTVILNTGIDTTKQAILIPPGFKITEGIDLDATNAQVYYILIDSNYPVNNLNGVPVTGYRLYIREQGIPFTSNHRHQITITTT